MPSDTYVKAQEAAGFITSHLPNDFPRLEIAIICGSGLSGLVSTFHADPQLSIPYTAIPNFPVSTVEGHANSLVFGTLGEKKTGIVAMVGRFHFYEGYDAAQVTLPVRVFHLLDIHTLIGLFRRQLGADEELQTRPGG
jgi:purine-nucleoside phosphorylase